MTRSMRLVGATLAFPLLAAAANPPALKTDPEAQFNSGLTHLREGRVDLAVEAFKAAVKEDGKNAYFYKGLGLAYMAKRDAGKAADAFRKGLELNPYYADLHNDLGSALSLAGKRDEARKEFLVAFNDATYPTPEMAARNMGQAYLADKNYAEAQNWFRTAITRNKDYPEGYLGLAQTLLAQDQTEQAVAQLELGSKQLPDSLALTLALADACYKAGRFNEARGYYEQVARKDPTGALGRRALERLRTFPR
jgi:Tfp pilus assembly protein PilF